MHHQQGGKCAICGKEAQRLQVDHCHNTGAVRGLLCFNCNSLLGKAFDNALILENAITYLQTNAEKRQAIERKKNKNGK